MGLFKNVAQRFRNNVRVFDSDGFAFRFAGRGLGFPRSLSTKEILADSLIVSGRAYISRAYSEPPLGLYNSTSKSFEPFPELDRLFARANGNNYSARNFRAAVGGDVGVLGNAYLYPRPNGTMELLPAAEVTISKDVANSNVIEAYTYGGKKIPADQVFHIRGLPDPIDPTQGLNLADVLHSMIVLDQRATAYLNLSLEKLGLLGVFVSPNMDVGPKDRTPIYQTNEPGRRKDDSDAATKRYNDALNGLQSGEGVSWPTDANINKIAPTPREMLALDIYRRTESRMAAVLAVSARLMELEFSAESSTFNNAAIARRWVAENLLIYLWDVTAEQASEFLLYHPRSPILEAAVARGISTTDAKYSLKFDLTKIPALQEWRFQETDWVLDLVRERVISREHAAELVKLPFTGDDDDFYFQTEGDRDVNSEAARARARVPSESAAG